MVTIDLENKTKFEEEERKTKLEQKHDTLHINAANQPSKGRKSSALNNKNSNKRKPPVQYESDSSNDGGTPSGNTDSTFRNPSFSGKLKNYTEAQNISSTPKLGSFSGPNNRSEFFAKGPKNKRAAAMKEFALSKKKANEDRRNVESMKESPSSRLSALAGLSRLADATPHLPYLVYSAVAQPVAMLMQTVRGEGATFALDSTVSTRGGAMQA